jgi:hypothetical protein
LFPRSRDTDENSRSGDHRVIQVRHDANTYTITVEPTGGGFQSILIRRLNPSAVLRFVTADGKELEGMNPRHRDSSIIMMTDRPVRASSWPNGEIIKKWATCVLL